MYRQSVGRLIGKKGGGNIYIYINNRNSDNVNVRMRGVLLHALTRSIGRGDLEAWPQEDRAPLIHWMADLRRENERRHLSQERVQL